MNPLTFPVRSLHTRNQQTNEQSDDNLLFDPMDLVSRLRELLPVVIVSGDKHQDKKLKGHQVIKESEVPSRLEMLLNNGQGHLRQNNFADCLLALKQADMLLTPQTLINCEIGWKSIVAVKVNLGICYYKIGFLEDSFSCFELTVTMMRRTRIGKDTFSFTKKKLTIQCLLQCCILLSEMGRHIEAVEFGKRALAKSVQLAIKMMEFSFQAGNDLAVLAMLHSLVSKFESLGPPILKGACMRRLFNNYQQVKIHLADHQVDLEPLFTKLNSPWVERANILSFLQIRPTYLEDLQATNEEQLEPNKLIHQVGLLSVSYYCISTEYRFLEKRQRSDNESENYLSHALEVAYLFLPHDMPIVGQIISVHTKFHGLTRQIIDEASDLKPQKASTDEFDIIVLKSMKGQQKGNFFVPLIRKYRNQGYFQKFKPTEDSNNSAQNTQQMSTSVHKKQSNQAKFQFPEMLLDSISRTKSAGRKTYTQQPSPSQQISQIKNLQEIYTSKPAKRPPQQNQLPSRTMQLNNPLAGLEEILRKPISMTQRHQQPQMNFFGSPQGQQMNQNFFERPRFDIQINNNINILIEEKKRPQVKARQLEHLSNESARLQPLNRTMQRGFITRKRSVSQKQQ